VVLKLLDGRTGQRYVWIQAAAFEFASCGILRSMRSCCPPKLAMLDAIKVDHKSSITLSMVAGW
jgi:hypothetical protein